MSGGFLRDWPAAAPSACRLHCEEPKATRQSGAASGLRTASLRPQWRSARKLLATVFPSPAGRLGMALGVAHPAPLFAPAAGAFLRTAALFLSAARLA